MKRQLLKFSFQLLTVAFVLTGCNDYLNVLPRETMKSDVLYSSQDGFRNALNGIYIQIADEDLYGKNASMYLPEYLVRHWTIPPTDKTANIYVISNYDFSNNKGNALITTIWTAYYKTIAQINDLLAHLETTDVKFSDMTYPLLKGEALGLRAFLHLEVLRLWGPVPALATKDMKTIPYVTEFTNNAEKTSFSTWQTVIESITKDLNDADSLLADIDPIKKFSPATLNSGNSNQNLEDHWFYYRQNRFNIYAVRATKARLYNWLATNNDYGTEAKLLAIQYAQEIIDAKNDTTKVAQFELYSRQTFSADDHIMMGECIFAAYNSNLSDVVLPLYENVEPTLTQTTENLDNAYEAAQNAQDVRYGAMTEGRYWVNSTDLSSGINANHFLKYSDKQKQVPLIRLPEMYFILWENLTPPAGNTTFNKFRTYRYLNVSLHNSLTSEAAVRERLEKEYRKEFYGEGQMFFFYKRHQYTTLPYPDAFALPQGLDNYMIPLPEGQQKFIQ
jgi:hypothetical protein